MLAYSKTYEEFCRDINQGQIVNQIRQALNRDFSASEKNSFRNSLGALKNALANTTIPKTAQVGLEFRVPLTQKRIDFIIAGEDEQNQKKYCNCGIKAMG